MSNLVIVEVAVKRDDRIIGAAALRCRQADNDDDDDKVAGITDDVDDNDDNDGIGDDDDDCIIGAAALRCRQAEQKFPIFTKIINISSSFLGMGRKGVDVKPVRNGAVSQTMEVDHTQRTTWNLNKEKSGILTNDLELSIRRL